MKQQQCRIWHKCILFVHSIRQAVLLQFSVKGAPRQPQLFHGGCFVSACISERILEEFAFEVLEGFFEGFARRIIGVVRLWFVGYCHCGRVDDGGRKVVTGDYIFGA